VREKAISLSRRLGTLNLITGNTRRKALALAKRGLVVSLEQPVVITPKPEATRRDGRSHAISFYEIRRRSARLGGRSGFGFVASW
jgi:hypothetical protein